MILLRGGPKSSGDLASTFDAAWPTVTRHLNVLKEADLITAERKGTSMIYRANASVLEELIAGMSALMGREDDSDEFERKDAAE